MSDIRSKIGFNAYQLKLVAIFAMLLDHIAVVFFPGSFYLRIIGRLTAPIMAFFIVEGYIRTKNVRRYALRLFIWALISMVPYYLVFRHSYFNILFDLLFGLLVLILTDMLTKEWQKWGVALGFAALAILLQTDGRLGITFLIFLLYRFRNDFQKMTSAMVMLYMSVFLLNLGYGLATRDQGILDSTSLYLRPLSLLALLLIKRYNGVKGRSIKFFFYGFYPAHLLILYLLMQFIE